MFVWLLSSHWFITALGPGVMILLTLREWGLRMGTRLPQAQQLYGGRDGIGSDSRVS